MNRNEATRTRRSHLLRLVLGGMTPSAAYRAMDLEPKGGTFHRDLKALVDTNALVKAAPELYVGGPGVKAWTQEPEPVVVPKTSPALSPPVLEGQGIRKDMDLGPKFGLDHVRDLSTRRRFPGYDRDPLVAPMVTAAGPGPRPDWIPEGVHWKASTSYTFTFLFTVPGVQDRVKVQVTGKNRWKAQYYLPPKVYHAATALDERNAYVKKGLDVAREVIRHVLLGQGTLDDFDPMDVTHEEVEHPIPADLVAPGWVLRDPDGNMVYTDATLKVLDGPGLAAMGTRGDLANFTHLAGPYSASVQAIQAARENRKALFQVVERVDQVQGDVKELKAVAQDLVKATGNLAKAVDGLTHGPVQEPKKKDGDDHGGVMYG